MESKKIIECKQKEILEIALSLFSSNGIKATRMDCIALHCGISKKTLYCQFKSK